MPQKAAHGCRRGILVAFGTWRSLVAHPAGGRKVASSQLAVRPMRARIGGPFVHLALPLPHGRLVGQQGGEVTEATCLPFGISNPTLPMTVSPGWISPVSRAWSSR